MKTRAYSNKNIGYHTFACILNYAESNEYFLLVTFSKWKPVISLFQAFYECYLNSIFKIIVFDKISFLALHEASQKLIRLTCVAISFLFLLLKFTYSLIISSNTKYQNWVLTYYNNVKKVVTLSYGQKFACKIFEIIMISLPRSSYFKSRAFQVCQNESLNWIEEVVAWHTL